MWSPTKNLTRIKFTSLLMNNYFGYPYWRDSKNFVWSDIVSYCLLIVIPFYTRKEGTKLSKDIIN